MIADATIPPWICFSFNICLDSLAPDVRIFPCASWINQAQLWAFIR